MELIKINSARDEANAIHTHARPGAGNSSRAGRKLIACLSAPSLSQPNTVIPRDKPSEPPEWHHERPGVCVHVKRRGGFWARTAGGNERTTTMKTFRLGMMSRHRLRARLHDGSALSHSIFRSLGVFVCVFPSW